MGKENLLVLVDLDDVTADFYSGFIAEWVKRHPDKPYVLSEARTKFKTIDCYQEELRPLVSEIISTPGFFRSLPPVPGAVEAVLEMADSGIMEVLFCTSPVRIDGHALESCASEKYYWVADHFGGAWTDRMMLTRDKTVVAGDILFDDNPEITGLMEPSWEQIVYDQPYNRDVTGKRRIIKWEDWKSVLSPELSAATAAGRNYLLP